MYASRRQGKTKTAAIVISLFEPVDNGGQQFLSYHDADSRAAALVGRRAVKSCIDPVLSSR
jgi:hypothetical protein